jgi:hypothetical protein
MTNRFRLEIVGDVWYNPNEFWQFLQETHAEKFIVLDFSAEGPSITALGISEMIQKINRDPATVRITGWSNNYEQVPYVRMERHHCSHFFDYSKMYWTDPVDSTNAPYLIGLFLGRNTVARNCIFYDSAHRWPDKFLISRLKNRNPDCWSVSPNSIALEKIEDWVAPDQINQIMHWVQTINWPSIDNKKVQDYYQENSAAECVVSLLRHYSQFHVDLVCETYSRGSAFFPTEKTVRPIMAGKPMLVYGPKNFLANLRALGFCTWSSCWDESYDQYEGPERWQRMRQVIDNLCNDQSMLSQAHSIALTNRSQLAKNIKYDYKNI